MRFHQYVLIMIFVELSVSYLPAMQIFVNPGGAGGFVVAGAGNGLEGPDLEWGRMSGRLEAHLGCYQSWLGAICNLSEEQNQRVTHACKASFERAKAHFEANRKPYQEFDMNEYPSTPIIFCGFEGAAPSLFDQQFNDEIKSILTSEQSRIVAELDAERKQSIHLACAGRITEIINEMMILTPTQCESIQKILSEKEPKFRNALFTFYPRWDETKSQLLDEQEWFPVSSLTPAQIIRPKTMRKSDWPNESFDSNTISHQLLLKKVEDRLGESRDSMMQYVSVYIDGYHDRLNEEDFRYFSRACEAAVDRFLVEYCRAHMNQLYEANELFQRDEFFVHTPSPFQMQHDEFWVAMLSHGKIYEVNQARAAERAVHVDAYLLTLFDQELWLTDTQRKSLGELLTNQMSKFTSNRRNDFYSREFRGDLGNLARLLFTLPEEELQQFLTKEQFKGWQTLKNEFQCEFNELHYHRRFGTYPLGELYLSPAPNNN